MSALYSSLLVLLLVLAMTVASGLVRAAHHTCSGGSGPSLSNTELGIATFDTSSCAGNAEIRITDCNASSIQFTTSVSGINIVIENLSCDGRRVGTPGGDCVVFSGSVTGG